MLSLSCSFSSAHFPTFFWHCFFLSCRLLQLLRQLLHLLMFWQEIISYLLNVLQFLSPLLFLLVHIMLRHICELIDLPHLLDKISLNLADPTSSLPFFVLFTTDIFTNWYAVHQLFSPYTFIPLNCFTQLAQFCLLRPQCLIYANSLPSPSPDGGEDPDQPRPLMVDTACMCLPCNTDGMFV